MVIVSRETQHAILEKLQRFYPDRTDLRLTWDETELAANLLYLEEHGLVDSGVEYRGNKFVGYSWSKITATGIDFLADDGGLAAILKTFTVKLHADTIRDLLAKKVDEADLPADEKSRLRKAVEGLPATALAAGAGDLVKMGLDHAPGALGYIRALIGF